MAHSMQSNFFFFTQNTLIFSTLHYFCITFTVVNNSKMYEKVFSFTVKCTTVQFMILQVPNWRDHMKGPGLVLNTVLGFAWGSSWAIHIIDHLVNKKVLFCFQFQFHLSSNCSGGVSRIFLKIMTDNNPTTKLFIEQLFGFAGLATYKVIK